MLRLYLASGITVLVGWMLLAMSMSIKDSFRERFCVCGHNQAGHDLTFVGSPRLGRTKHGGCLGCLCREFIER